MPQPWPKTTGIEKWSQTAMAIEQGIVTKMGASGPATAWVKTVPSGACASCSSRHSCHTGPSGQDREVEVINAVGAAVGDRIQLAIGTGSLLKVTFLLYLFPIISMLFGGLAVHTVAARYYSDTSLLSASAAAICLVIALAIVRVRGGRMAQKEAYRPKIIRVIGHSALYPPEPGPSDPCASQ